MADLEIRIVNDEVSSWIIVGSDLWWDFLVMLLDDPLMRYVLWLRGVSSLCRDFFLCVTCVIRLVQNISGESYMRTFAAQLHQAVRLKSSSSLACWVVIFSTVISVGQLRFVEMLLYRWLADDFCVNHGSFLLSWLWCVYPLSPSLTYFIMLVQYSFGKSHMNMFAR